MKQAPVQVSVILPGPVQTEIFNAVQPQHDDPVVAGHHQAMVDLLAANGMSASEAASTIFSQLKAGKFWVSTHPEMTQMMAKQRAKALSELTTPSMDMDSAFNLDSL
jgi:short-subunit dehydrogenase